MTLHDRLQDIFRTVLGDETLTLRDETTAADVEGWDSVANINLMFSIESEFGVQFAGNAFAELADVGALKRYLEEQGHGQSAA